MREDWVTLVTMNFSGSYNAAGTEVSRKNCWAEKKDANRSEYYAALDAGHTIDAIFEVSPLDFSGQQRLIHGSDVYDIVRSYQLSNPSGGSTRQGYSGVDKIDTVQLSCTRRTSL
jgi:hypothetical protein